MRLLFRLHWINKKKIVEGVEKVMGGQILEYEAKEILNKGRKEGMEVGRAAGREEGRDETIKKMLTQLVLSKLKKHKSPEAIADALEISEDKVLDIARQNGFAI